MIVKYTRTRLYHDDIVDIIELAAVCAEYEWSSKRLYHHIQNTYTNPVQWSSIAENIKLSFDERPKSDMVVFTFFRNIEKTGLCYCVWSGPSESGHGTQTVQLYNHDRDRATNARSNS